jgi:hypothetical protein
MLAYLQCDLHVILVRLIRHALPINLHYTRWVSTVRRGWVPYRKGSQDVTAWGTLEFATIEEIVFVAPELHHGLRNLDANSARVRWRSGGARPKTAEHYPSTVVLRCVLGHFGLQFGLLCGLATVETVLLLRD